MHLCRSRCFTATYVIKNITVVRAELNVEYFGHGILEISVLLLEVSQLISRERLDEKYWV